MSAERVIFALLSGYAPLTAVVPIDRIVPGEIPVKVALPAIGYTHISSVDDPCVSAMPTTMVTSRIQIDVVAKTYAQTKSILMLINQACDRRGGPIAGVRVQHVRRDTTGPDMSSPDATIFSQSVDYKLTFSDAH